jgi:uncharacterized SAM-binding protein YcdF (DUF218 family)
MLNYLIPLIISPLNQSFFLIFISLLILKFTSFPKWIGKSIMIFSFVWLALCSQYFFSYILIAPLESQFPPLKVKNKKWQDATAIWVLACYHYDADALPLVSQFTHCSMERLVQAANMYRIKPIPIYLTGGAFNKDTQKSHANQAAKFLVTMGVPKKDIRIIEKGINTLSEAQALKTKLKMQKIAVVSSATHGLRLSYILQQQDINFTFVPVHFSTKAGNKYKLNMPSNYALMRSERALYEYAALAKYFMLN